MDKVNLYNLLGVGFHSYGFPSVILYFNLTDEVICAVVATCQNRIVYNESLSVVFVFDPKSNNYKLVLNLEILTKNFRYCLF